MRGDLTPRGREEGQVDVELSGKNSRAPRNGAKGCRTRVAYNCANGCSQKLPAHQEGKIGPLPESEMNDGAKETGKWKHSHGQVVTPWSPLINSATVNYSIGD